MWEHLFLGLEQPLILTNSKPNSKPNLKRLPLRKSNLVTKFTSLLGLSLNENTIFFMTSLACESLVYLPQERLKP